MSIEDTYLKTLHERLSQSEFGETVLACKTFIESEIRLLNTIVRNRGRREMVLNDELLPILIHCGVFSDVPLEDKIERLIEISTVQRNKKIEAVCRYLLISFWNKEGMGEQIGKHLSRLNGINRQSISGKTILMILADIETFDHQSFSAFKMESVIADNITTVCQILLSRGASVNSVAENGQTPLHLAVAAQNAPLCLLLLEKGADVTAVDRSGQRPYHMLIVYYSWKLGEKFPRIPSAGMSAKYGAAICRMFFERGESIDETDRLKNTLLHRAASTGDTDMVLWLIKKQCNLNGKNYRNQAPLHISSIIKDKFICELLINFKAYRYIQDVFGNMPVHYAALDNSYRRVPFDCLQPPESLCLRLFIDQKDLDEMRTENISGWNILHLSCLFNNVDGVGAILRSQIIDVNARTSKSKITALMIVCRKGFNELAEILLAHPSLDSSLQDEYVGNALEWACEFERLYICRMMLGSKFNQQSERTKARLLRRACNNDSQSLINLFFDTWKKWDTTDEEGNTVMHEVCLEGYDNVLELLLTNISSSHLGLGIKNAAKKTPSECARMQGHQRIVERLHSAQIIS